MKATPLMFILFRFYLMSFGKTSFGSRWVKRFLVWRFIWKEKERYVASSKYFTPDELC